MCVKRNGKRFFRVRVPDRLHRQWQAHSPSGCSQQRGTGVQGTLQTPPAVPTPAALPAALEPQSTARALRSSLPGKRHTDPALGASVPEQHHAEPRSDEG